MVAQAEEKVRIGVERHDSRADGTQLNQAEGPDRATLRKTLAAKFHHQFGTKMK